jgi:hypothetical protein
MKGQHYFSDAQNATTPSENTPKQPCTPCQQSYFSQPHNIHTSGQCIQVGKADSQKGQRLTLRCSECRRPLRIYLKQKTVSSPPKLVVLDGSAHQTETGTTKIHIRCKCGAKMVFENQSVSKHGWKRIQ